MPPLLLIAPREVLATISVVLVAGVVLFAIASVLKGWKTNWKFSAWIIWLGEYWAWEVLRDLGIAFFVAGVVSGVYEWSTRSIDENRKAVELFDKINSYNMGQPVWEEIKREVLRSPRLRQNIKIRLSISSQWTDESGRLVELAPFRGVLRMEYRYDLYPLTSECWRLPVQHDLDNEMYDKTLNLPRFEAITFIRQFSLLKTQSKTLQGEELKKFVKDGKFSVDPAAVKEIDFPTVDESRPVTIINIRYEVINMPGQYRLIMPVLAAPSVGEHTITLAIDDLPANVQPEINTFYSGLKFNCDAQNRNCTFDGVMLPGQGFSVVLKRNGVPTP